MRNLADNRVHFSDLKHMARSPAHYRWACEHPQETTRHMLVGSLVDAMVFRTHELVPIDARRGTKDWLAAEALAKQPKPAWPAGVPGRRSTWPEGTPRPLTLPKLFCNASEHKEADCQAIAIKNNPTAQELLAGSEYQTVLQWESNGMPCATGIEGNRGGVDILNRGKRYLGDLKSTRSSEPEEMSRQAYRMFWHAQIAWNIDGCRANGIDVQFGYLLGVESAPPYCVTVLELTEQDLELGRKEIWLWMERLRSCEAANVWPGYVQSIVPMVTPRRMREEEEDE